MTNRIRVAAVTALAAGAIGLTGGTSTAASPSTDIWPGPPCPTVCPQIYKPVKCLMSNGRVYTFPNRCFADVFACTHRLLVIVCLPARG